MLPMRQRILDALLFGFLPGLAHLVPLIKQQLELFVFLLQLQTPVLWYVAHGEFFLCLLILHLQPSCFDFSGAGAFQVSGEADPRKGADQPLGRVKMPPFDTIPVVPLKRVVKIMVTLSISDQGEKGVVSS